MKHLSVIEFIVSLAVMVGCGLLGVGVWFQLFTAVFLPSLDISGSPETMHPHVTITLPLGGMMFFLGGLLCGAWLVGRLKASRQKKH